MSSTALPFEAVEALDRKLARLARNDGLLRLELGAGLEALARISGHHELGFASVETYALERCERSARWVQESRALARRLENLPALRRALLVGEVSFSMAQLLAKVTSAESERAWLAQAEARTVREMRLIVRRADDEGDTNEVSTTTSTEEALATLTVTVDREDAWLFECARMVGQQLSALTMSDTLEALLGEGTTSLLARVRRENVAELDDSDSDVAQREWEAELGRWRDEAEARCEEGFRKRHAGIDGAETTVQREFEFDGCERDPSSIDAKLRQIAGELARRDLELGRLAEQFWTAEGWRRLGYATETQYVRERLGMSWSTVKAKRALVRRAEQLPQISTALAAGQLGYEAARLVALVATPETVEEWLARASGRTVRCLREEVDAMEMFARLAPGRMTSPPSEETMHALAALESRVVSGAMFREARAGQMSAGVRRSVAPHSGRVTLRFRVSAEMRRYYRWLERLFARSGPPGLSFFGFLCHALLDAWQRALGSTAEYAHVYARDHYRCCSPVCRRRDVTPHHLRFRSAGGDDSLENLASLCVWCHLEGVHGGRLRASPPASDIGWTIGRTGHTVVRGRRRLRAEDAASRTCAN